METFKNLTDHELFEKCKEYGRNARLWLRQFAALLFEVEKRQLYKKYKFYNIYDFAARLANMNRATVDEVLRVSEKLDDKPILKSLIETQGWSKLRVVANSATQENDQFLAEKVKTMNKSTLEVYIQELKQKNLSKEPSCQFLPGEENGAPTLFDDNATSGDTIGESGEKPTNELESESAGNPENGLLPYAPNQSRLAIRLFLEPETELKLRELQRKLSKEQHSPVAFNEVIKFLLNHYESSKIHRTKKVADEEELEQLKNEPCAKRYIPAAVRNLLSEKYHGRCAFPNCHKLPDIFHHTRRFSLVPNHNPDFLVPLCKNHERLAHLGLIGNEEQLPSEWYVREEPEKTTEKFRIDEIVNHYRLSNH